MSLAEILLSALLQLPTYKEDVEQTEAKRAQLTAVAQAVATVAGEQTITSSKNWAALIVAIGQAESGFSLRIHAGQCKPLECDRGKARSPWQLHRYAEAVPTWDQLTGVENTAVQVRVASARLRRGYYTCKGSADWLIATVNGYAGRKCSSVWPGLEQRVATWRSVVRAMEKAARESKS